MIRARCEVLSSRRSGVYWSVTLVAPDIAEQAKPGQFVQIAVPEGRKFILRRLLALIPILIGVTFLSFLIISFTPGDYLSTMSLNPDVSPARIASWSKASCSW